MPRYIALLRGVNVGKAKRIPMEGLRAMLVASGYGEVSTLLNSGNAVFSAGAGKSASLAAAISASIGQTFAIEVPVIVKSAKELQAIVDESPFGANPATSANPSACLLCFAQEPEALAKLLPLGALVEPPEEFLVGKNAAYLHCANGILESKVGSALLGKAAGMDITTRNWATVLKLHERVHAKNEQDF